MRRACFLGLILWASLLVVCACQMREPARDPETVVMLIESTPTNLDPRIGTDAQSERIDQLLFSALFRRDEHMQLVPDLVTDYQIPDPRTYIFHLRRDVRFHDGRPLEAADVKFTFDSMLGGEVATVKTATYRWVERIDAPDAHTVVFRLAEPFAPFLWNLSNGAIGIVPRDAGKDFGAHPIGSGPFRFVGMKQDEEVVLERHDGYYGARPAVARVRFKIVPEATVRALELRKGSADLALNSLTPDMVEVLRRDRELAVLQQPGTIYMYVAVNFEDPILSRREVRQAIAYAIDREPILRYLWRDEARPASSMLPPSHWAFEPATREYAHDPAQARALLDAAGFRPRPDGARFTLSLKTSTEETSRLVAAILQEQLRAVGIRLDIRSYEFATFYADIVKGQFQLYMLRWIGANNDPDIFEYVFHSQKIPPHGANRGHYRNPEVDRLIDAARVEMDLNKRKRYYSEIQKIIAEDLPYINLWYFDNVCVYNRRLTNLRLYPAGDYDFLRDVRVRAVGRASGTAE